MTYRIRPGIVLINICGQNLLAATRPVWEQCPRVRKIPRLWAACWKIMEDGKTDQDVIEAFAGLLQKKPEEIRSRFESIFQTLEKEGYLICEDIDSKKETQETIS